MSGDIDSTPKYWADRLKREVPISPSAEFFYKANPDRIHIGPIYNAPVFGVPGLGRETHLYYNLERNTWSGTYENSEGIFDLDLLQAAELARDLGIESAVNAYCVSNELKQPNFNLKPDCIAVKNKDGFVLVDPDEQLWNVKGTGQFVEIAGNVFELQEAADKESETSIRRFFAPDFEDAWEPYSINKCITVTIDPQMNKELYLCAEAIECLYEDYGDEFTDAVQEQLKGLASGLCKDFDIAAQENKSVLLCSVQNVLKAADFVEKLDQEYELENLEQFRGVELDHILFRGTGDRKKVDAVIDFATSPMGKTTAKPVSFRDPAFTRSAEALNEKQAGNNTVKEENCHE